MLSLNSKVYFCLIVIVTNLCHCRKMTKIKEKESKLKQFRWSVPMDRLMLEILADEALRENKLTNTFKHESFVRVAQVISEKFGVECQPIFVENHLRTVKSLWITISKI